VLITSLLIGACLFSKREWSKYVGELELCATSRRKYSDKIWHREMWLTTQRLSMEAMEVAQALRLTDVQKED